MMKPALITALFLATSAFAQPHITSVTPSSGPVTGGTTITIHGSGFDTSCTPDLLVCGRTTVEIGGLPATSFHIVDTQTIEAVTPSAFPGAVSVAVTVARGGAELPDAFTYTGNASDAFDRVLLPVFIPETPGTFGTRFGSSFSMLNTAGPDVQVFGLDMTPPCLPNAVCPPDLQPFVLQAGAGAAPPDVAFTGNPGRLVYISKGSFDRVAASLRIVDASRPNTSAGTRIPVVPEREFRSDVVSLLDVPPDQDNDFRYTLRVYSLDPGTTVHVTFLSNDTGVTLRSTDLGLLDPADAYHPAYAEYSAFHPRQTVRVEVRPTTPGKRVWAFVSITGNVTQEVTVVAPH